MSKYTGGIFVKKKGSRKQYEKDLIKRTTDIHEKPDKVKVSGAVA